MWEMVGLVATPTVQIGNMDKIIKSWARMLFFLNSLIWSPYINAKMNASFFFGITMNQETLGVAPPTFVAIP